MSLFKKVARAFVVIEDEDSGGTPRPKTPSAPPAMDDLGSDAADLLAQLQGGSTHSQPPSDSARSASGPTGAPVVRAVVGGPRSATPPANVVQNATGGPALRAPDVGSSAAPKPPLFSMTASDVFLSAGIADSPSSAERMLKMLAGLAMFPREQQRYMIQAMDAADPTWTEQTVQSDAQARVQALQTHLQRIHQEKGEKQKALADQMGETQAKGNEILSEIDKQIAELQKMREEALKETTLELDRLTMEGRQLEEQARTAGGNISQVIENLSHLITFLGNELLSQAQASSMPPQSHNRPQPTPGRRS